MPWVSSTCIEARMAAVITTQSPVTLRTRLHHAHSVTQMPSACEPCSTCAALDGRPPRRDGAPAPRVDPVSWDTIAPRKEKPNETLREASPPRRSIGTDRHCGGCKGWYVPALCHLAYIGAPPLGKAGRVGGSHTQTAGTSELFTGPYGSGPRAMRRS